MILYNYIKIKIIKFCIIIALNPFKAVIDVSGRWLIELPDRYGWWYKLLPLIMTGLHDELAEICIKAADMWDAAGKLYMKENENDEKLKDKMDFLTEDPDHYPPESEYIIFKMLQTSVPYIESQVTIR